MGKIIEFDDILFKEETWNAKAVIANTMASARSITVSRLAIFLMFLSPFQISFRAPKNLRFQYFPVFIFYTIKR